MRFTSILALSATLSLSASFGALAHNSSEPHKTPNFDYVQAGYTQMKESDIKLDGMHFEGSFSVAENMFIRGRYQDVSGDIEGTRAEVDMSTLAIGYKAPVSAKTSYYMALSYEQIDAGPRLMSNTDDGFGAYLGAKSFVSPELELYGELSYVNIHDLDMSEIGYEFGAQYYFSDQWSVGANYRKLDDVSLVNAGIRFSF